jgi:ceramide glucosyltransferase
LFDIGLGAGGCSFVDIVRDTLIALVCLGLAQGLAGVFAVRAFVRRPPRACPTAPAVTVLKPVCGAEPLLEEALASFCRQSYPGQVQIVIGAHDAADPALEAARRAKTRFPHADIVIQADPLRRGTNGKIANLMNMLPLAKHDMLVIADSDLHVEPDYLRRVVAELLVPGTGLVTTLPAGEPAVPGLAARLGTAHLAHIFLPSALIAQALGRQDCLGGTMALTRTTLARAGGLAALANHLADDNILGRKVLDQGLSVRLANTLPSVTVQDASIGALWQHELRWGRTIASVAPVSYAGCLVQYPLFWAIAAVLVSAGQPWALATLALAWAGKAMLVRGVETCLAARRPRPVARTPAWLLPLRDLLSVAEIVASFCGDTVVWRGRTLHTGGAEPVAADTCIPELAPGL